MATKEATADVTYQKNDYFLTTSETKVNMAEIEWEAAQKSLAHLKLDSEDDIVVKEKILSLMKFMELLRTQAVKVMMQMGDIKQDLAKIHARQHNKGV